MSLKSNSVPVIGAGLVRSLRVRCTGGMELTGARCSLINRGCWLQNSNVAPLTNISNRLLYVTEIWLADGAHVQVAGCPFLVMLTN